jgi:ketosteroid isomerase-like protein
MTDQDKKQLATSFIEALRAGDANGFRAIMTDDVFWSLPGTSLVSGIAKGVDGILKRARTIVDYGANVISPICLSSFYWPVVCAARPISSISFSIPAKSVWRAFSC